MGFEICFLEFYPPVFWYLSTATLPLQSSKKELMANHKATQKDARQAEKRRVRNKYYGKTTRNAIRDLREIKDKKEAGEKMPTTVAMIDKLAKKGIIHKNTAAHLKSKLAKRINKLGK
jgi:small subunit ribosomal protein S20